MNKLDILSFPFHQNALIEASAGTGKTYTISNLYLRLILGHDCPARRVTDILVLTFTNAATGELKDRILKRIRHAWRDFARGTSQDPFISQLMRDVPNREAASQRLLVAAQDMDLASVFTIHGFCQRLLTEYAFESGSAWDEALLLDDSDMLIHASTDYWRKFIANLDVESAKRFLKKWRSPQELSKSLRPVISRDIGFEDPVKLLSQWQSTESRYLQLLAETRAWWSDNNISEMLQEADLKANVKLAKPTFLALMRNFALEDINETELLQTALGKDGWLTLSPERVNKARKKSSKEFDLTPFEVFDELAELQVQLNKVRQQYYFWHSLHYVREHLQVNKRLLAELSPDDLLKRVNQALSEENDTEKKNITENDSSKNDLSKKAAPQKKTSLKTLIRSKYPIAMVDEFQDTDQTQFDIFKILYQSDVEQNVALIMIGDPKQAIYSFRGGDIYTYLLAREFVAESARYTLATNWRSQPGLVSAVNTFFARSDSGFMHEAMPFFAVSAGKSEKQLLLNNKPLSALTCRVLLSESLSSSTTSLKGDKGDTDLLKIAPSKMAPLKIAPLKWNVASEQMASQTARAIQYYLHEAQIDGKPCLAADICVLVRDRFEAELIQTALQKRQIDSVFLLKETVFKSPVTYSILLLLKAIEQYKSESQIKAALLDHVFGFTQQTLSELNTDTLAWQESLELFHQAFDIWTYRGVMSAIEFICRSFCIFEKLKSDVQHYQRAITDIRHLSEVLQQQSTRIEGKSALITWFQERVARPELLASDGLDDTQWRLETDNNLVQISTIHGSKGLQYPFVFIPFISRYKDAQSGFYHDENQDLRFNFSGDEDVIEVQTKERLAEDIRLLYVALTRAELHCWLGVWDNNVSGRKVESGFIHTAFGRLLDARAEDTPQHDWLINIIKQRFSGESVDVLPFDEAEYWLDDGVAESLSDAPFSADSQSKSPQSKSPQSKDAQSKSSPLESTFLNETLIKETLSKDRQTENRRPKLTGKTLSRVISQTWQMTSYSGISKTRELSQHSESVEGELKASDEANSDVKNIDNNPELVIQDPEQIAISTEDLPMRFRFERGASPGSYLHEVLEYSDFSDGKSVLDNCMAFTDKFSISEANVSEIANWLIETLHTPINTQDCQEYCLADIKKTQKIPEMEFYLPINDLNIATFNRLITQWLPDFDGKYFARESKLKQLNGMLKGYLDLVYLQGNRLYVADYKSNFLGAKFEDYQQQQLHEAMLHHDYYLQALLYTLAMHRFMKNKLSNYSYKSHIGGAQYLFLRGMSVGQKGCGVLTVQPPLQLIESLDKLFLEGEVEFDTEDNGISGEEASFQVNAE